MVETEKTDRNKDAIKISFQVPLTGNLTVKVKGSNVVFQLNFIEADGKVKTVIAQEIPNVFFKSDAQLNAWVRGVSQYLKENLPDAHRFFTFLFVGNIANVILVQQGLASFDLREVIKDHQKQTGDMLRKWFNLRAVGRPATRGMSPTALIIVINKAMAGLPKSQRTYDKVAAAIKKEHGNFAPRNGEALRKIVRDWKIDWMKLKRNAENGINYESDSVLFSSVCGLFT